VSSTSKPLIVQPIHRRVRSVGKVGFNFPTDTLQIISEMILIWCKNSRLLNQSLGWC